MEKIIITCLVLASALYVVITLLFSKKSNKSYKAEENKQVQIIEKTPGTEPNQEQEKISIEKIEPTDMIQEEKPEVERYCYQVNGKFFWKARKNEKPKTKAPKNYDLLDPVKFLQEQEKVAKSRK